MDLTVLSTSLCDYLPYLFSVTLGVIFGTISGLLPGVGHLLALTLSSPFLIKLTALEIFLFYLVMVQVSQFLGSLTTIFTQIPGETSSMPIVIETQRLSSSRLHDAVSSTAIGSFFGMLIAILISLFFLDLITYSSYIYRTEVIFVLFSLAMITMFYIGQDPFIIKILMLFIGSALGLVGYNLNLETNILTFDRIELTAGIPTILVLMCVFAIPQLWKLRDFSLLHKLNHIRFATSWKSMQMIPISSLLGFFGGLMPGLATIFSSQTAYTWAKWRTKDPVLRITASETANNAGAVSQMIPMLILGLPIVNSEALTLSLMEARGYVAGIGSGISYMTQGIIPLLIGSTAAIIIAWPLCLYTIRLLSVKMYLVRIIIIGILCLTVLWEAYYNMQLIFYLICFFALITLGWYLKKYDTMILVFAFFISERWLDYAIRMITFYIK